MNNIKDNSADSNNDAKTNHHVKSVQKDCRSEVRDFLKKLEVWKDESQRQFSMVVNSHSNDIIEAMDNLVEENCDLQAKLSSVTQEKNDLTVTVNDMRGELKQISAKLLAQRPAPKPVDTHHQDVDDLLSSELRIPEAEDQGIEVIGISNENVDKGEGEVIRNAESGIQQQNKISPTSDINTTEDEALREEMNPSGTVEIGVENVTESEDHIPPTNESRHGEHNKVYNRRTMGVKSFKCEQCPYSTVRKNKIRQHILEMHEKYKNSSLVNTVELVMANGEVKKGVVVQLEDKKFKCEQCPFSFAHKNALNLHIKGVHEKIRNYDCAMCGFATTLKGNLKQHLELVHRLGHRKFECRQCPFSTGLKGSLKNHIEAVHEKKRNHVCDKCGYAASQKGNLDHHRASVHKKEVEKKLKCELCPFKSRHKGHFMKHIYHVHKNTRSKFIHTSLSKSTEFLNPANQNVVDIEVETQNTEQKSATIINERLDHEEYVSNVPVQKPDTYSLNGKEHLNDSTFKELGDVRTNDVEHEEVNVQEVSIPEVQNGGEKQFKCEQCPYSSAHKCIMMAHTKVVHENITDYVCCQSKECGFVASQVRQHRKSVHEGTDKKFWCSLCSHGNNLKKCLLSHMKYVHKMKDT